MRGLDHFSPTIRRSALIGGPTLAAVLATFFVMRGTNEIWSARAVLPAAGGGFGVSYGGAASGRVPAEFEHHDALLIGANDLLERHPQLLGDIVAAVGSRATIIALIADPTQEARVRSLLAARSISHDAIRFLCWPARMMWVRDFGPLSAIGVEPRLIDFDYNIENADAENQLPLVVAATYGMKITPVPLTIEGGNLLVNGRGLGLTTNIVPQQNKSRGYDANAVGGVLLREFGVNRWTYLAPLVGEPTQHVDMFVTLTSPTTAVVGSYDPIRDPENAQLLDQAAETIRHLTQDGVGMEVVRIPMPPHTDGLWRTYTNVVYVNGVVLVPQYPDVCPELDRRALEIYRQTLPDWAVIGVNASSLIRDDGSLHCVTCNLARIPALDKSAE